MLSLPIDKMTLQEKLYAIDALWNSISFEPSEEVSPNWHQQVLHQRQQQIQSGEITFEDWDTVKKELQDWTSEN